MVTTYVQESETEKKIPSLEKPGYLSGILLICILAGAFFLRFYGSNFGLPQLYYWDEPALINRAIRFGSGDFNPHFFYYPGLYFYVLFGVSGFFFVLGFLSGHFSSIQDFAAQYIIDPSGVYLSCRIFTVLVGTACVWMLYLVGKRYFGNIVGLIGAAFLAVSVLPTTFSHVAVTDIPQLFFIIAAYLPLLSISRNRSKGAYFLAGIFIGLAIASKYGGIFLLPSLLVAHFFSGSVGLPFTYKWPRILSCWFSPRLLLAGVGVITATFIGTPFNFLDFGSYLEDLKRQTVYSGGDASSNSFSFFILQAIPFDIGWPIYILALVGLILIIYRRKGEGLLFITFPILFLLFFSRYSVVFARYMIPVSCFLCLSAAYAFYSAIQLMGEKFRWPEKADKFLLPMGVLLLLIVPLNYTIRWDIMMVNDTDPRTEALNWVNANIPAGTVVSIQSVYDRTFLNVPLLTDKKIEYNTSNIPTGKSFTPVRDKVAQDLSARKSFREIDFVYDYETLKKAGVKYLFVSEITWPDSAKEGSNSTSTENIFRKTLHEKATLVKSFVPITRLDYSDLYPVSPCTIEVYDLN